MSSPQNDPVALPRTQGRHHLVELDAALVVRRGDHRVADIGIVVTRQLEEVRARSLGGVGTVVADDEKFGHCSSPVLRGTSCPLA
jgi:hypothetical protein